MEIQVNQQQLDFSLEGTETVASVLSQLTQWVEDGGEFIIESVIDGQDVSGGLPPSLAEQQARDISSISLTTCPPLEFRLRRLTIMDNYLSLMEEAVLKGSLAEMQSITAEYPYLQHQLAQELNGSDTAGNSELNTIVQALQIEKKNSARNNVAR